MSVSFPVPTAGMSRLRQMLEAGRFVVTAEVTPPLATDPEPLLRKAKPLAGLADAVNVTDGAGARTRMSSLAAASLLVREGIEPILQLTCRDRNRIGLFADALGAAALGIRNILVLRGDDPSVGDQPDAKPVFDLESRTLLSGLANMRERGELPGGQKIEGPTDFFLGAADAPIDPPPGWAPHGLAAKVETGAEFAQTQFCMDPGVVRRYVARLREHGLIERIRLLIGVAPLVSAGSARWMLKHLPGVTIPESLVTRMEKATDPKKEGKLICIELLQELAKIPGVAGAHIMAPLNDESVPDVIAAVRSATRRD